MFTPKVEDHLELGIVLNAMFPDAARVDEGLLQAVDYVLHDSYFQRVELSGIGSHQLQTILKNRLDVCRVKNSYLAQPVIFREQLDLGSADRSVRLHAIERMLSCLSEAEAVGADMLELISGPNHEGSKCEAMERFAESILILSEHAQARDIKLLVEMFDFDVDKKRLIGSVENTVQLFQQFISSASQVKLLLDLSHIPMVRADIAAAVQELGPWIGHVHVGNTVMKSDDRRYGDSHPYFGYPAGENDVEQLVSFFHALLKTGYIHHAHSSAISFELICAAVDRPADLIANAKRTLQLAWRKFLREMGE
ncbi:hypothetical protein BBD42_07325 [Paenibacillus sp. BIHB 4019]|uniref:Xylose isomerase-like TIM barrel domain-containing protein n=1 Tax=Paenibacillus sp. BIHB 4019 TaxID=1870819 RepID=A0A1B2DF41_9BACL|nr:TIM barrel protein [Paenibacillus sp. BIHB 4019]ANY66299.1 hypothetical protein BBD42_07325 [Paenibacillus sp. BIHB 4019]